MAARLAAAAPGGPGLANAELQMIAAQEQQSAAEFTHLCLAFGDCVESLPPTITRSISDLRELDAVLSGSLVAITDKLNHLLGMIEDPSVSALERLSSLRAIAEEARSFRLGGEDKIRVATGTCETLVHHTNQMDVLANLLTTLLPASMAGTVPPPTWPHGYPVLFPTPASASGTAYRKPDYLPAGMRTSSKYSNFAAGPGGLPASIEYYQTRHAQIYGAAADAVRAYQRDGVPAPNHEHIQAQIAASQAGPVTSFYQAGSATHQSSHAANPNKRSRASGGGGRSRANRPANGSSNNHNGSSSSRHNDEAVGNAGSTSARNSPALAHRQAYGSFPAATVGDHVAGSGINGANQRSRGDEDTGFIPYANPARARASLDSVAENAAANAYPYSASDAGSIHPGQSASNGNGNGNSNSKKRRSGGNSGRQASQSDYNGHGNSDPTQDGSVYDEGAAAGDGSAGVKRQNSGRASVPSQSPVVTAGQAPASASGVKRARQSSKRGGFENSPDPASPRLASNSLSKVEEGATAVNRSASRSGGPAAPAGAATGSSSASAAAASSSAKSYGALGVPALVHTYSDPNAQDHESGLGTASDSDPGEDDYGYDDPGDDRTYCYCDKVSYGSMIGCDNDTCKREWFHLACVGLSDPPKGEWFCKECTEEKAALEASAAANKKRRT